MRGHNVAARLAVGVATRALLGGCSAGPVPSLLTSPPAGSVDPSPSPQGSLTPSTAELYDPGTGRWTATGSMVEGRMGHTATQLLDGSVLVTGGCACSDPDTGERVSAERYDPGSGRWIATGSMGTARIGHTATLLPDGTVLVVDDGLNNRQASAELYDPRTGLWTATASPDRARIGYTATLLPDGTVLVAGDYIDNSLATELYGPGSGT